MNFSIRPYVRKKKIFSPGTILFSGALVFASLSNPLLARNDSDAKYIEDLSVKSVIHGEIISLDSKWRYYPRQFIFSGSTDKISDPILSNGDFSYEHLISSIFKNGNDKYGSLALKLHIPEELIESHVIHIPSVYCASRIFILDKNGNLITKPLISGTPSMTPDEEVPYFKPYLIPLKNLNIKTKAFKKKGVGKLSEKVHEIEIIIEFSSFHTWMSGLSGMPSIGDDFLMARNMRFSEKSGLFIMGALLSLAIYHIFLFAKEHSRLASLLFAVLAILSLLQSIVDHSLLVSVLSTRSDYSSLIKIQLAAYYAGPIILILFISHVFPGMPRKIPLIATIIASVVSLAIVTFTSIQFMSNIKGFIFVIYIPVMAYLTLGILLTPDLLNDPKTFLLISGLVVIGGFGAQEFFYTVFPDNYSLFLSYAPIIALILLSLVVIFDINTDWNRERQLSVSLAVETNRKSGELQNTIRQIRQESQNLARELEVAGGIQRNLIPRTPLYDRYIKVDVFCQPRDGVGGDFYDVLHTGDGTPIVILADATGSGIPAAFLNAMAKISFQNAVNKESEAHSILNQVDNDITTAVHSNAFLSSSVYVINIDGRVSYADASLGPPLILRNNGSIESPDVPSGYYLGICNKFGGSYGETVFNLNSEERVFIFTDGFINQPGLNNESYGIDRLKKKILETSDLEIEDCRKKIAIDWVYHTDNTRLRDDATLLILEFGKT